MTMILKAVAAAALALPLLAAPAWSQNEAPGPGLYEASLQLRAQTRAFAAQADWEAARRTNAAALSLQPGHPGLLTNAVLIAGAAGDTQAQLSALEAIGAAGLAFDLEDLPEETRTRLAAAEPRRWSALGARLADNAGPVGDARVFARADIGAALIEAIAIDIENERLFFGGVADPGVWRLDPFMDSAERLAGPEDGLTSVLGLAYDRQSQRLYAATGRVPQSPVSEDGSGPGPALLALDPHTGAITARHEIEGAASFGDVVSVEGVIYASDPDAGRVYRLGEDGLEVFADDPRFASPQGLAPARDALWLADYALGLWRIDLRDGAVSLVDAGPESLIGLDGLVADQSGALYAVRNGTQPGAVLKLTPGEGGEVTAEPVLRGHRLMGEPTQIRYGDGRLFLLANAGWPHFPEDPAAEPIDPPVPAVLSFQAE